MKRLIITGSPRTNGRSAHLAEMLFEANIDEHPEDELFLVPLSEVEVGPCIACDACREKMPVTRKDDGGAETTVQLNRCVFDDDMQTLYDLFDEVDEVTVVSPVFFSGAPAQLKCLLDRLQPYYWANARAEAKRPATLHVIGEGGDPHGYDALVSEVRSALAVAGFRLVRVFDWVGKIREDGEITAEAKEVVFGEDGQRQRPKLNLSAGDRQKEPDSSGGGDVAGAGSAGAERGGSKPRGSSRGQGASREGKPQQVGGSRSAKASRKGGKRGGR